MKLLAVLSAYAVAQEFSGDDRPDFSDFSVEEIFGEASSELNKAAVAFDDAFSFFPGTFARGLGGGLGELPEDGTMIGGRQLPPGINMYDFVGADGVFNMSAFREALMTAYEESATGFDKEVVEEGIEEERYFFTTVTTTTTTTTTTATVVAGSSCWQCDAMSYTQCAGSGTWQTCPLGDLDCCFVEVRSKYMKLQQLCTGCKDKRACEDNRKQNFAVQDDTSIRPLLDQCRPSFYLQMKNKRWGSQQSVCRQCFRTCDPSQFGGRYCFGGGLDDDTGKPITMPFATSAGNYPAAATGGLTDTAVLGIPSGLMLSQDVDATAIAAITAFTHGKNLYFDHASNGKLYDGDDDDNRELDEMTYWSLEGADKAWWRSELKDKQTAYEALSADSCTSNAADDLTFAQTGCTVGVNHLDL